MPSSKPSPAPDAAPPRKRKWRRRLLITGLLLIILGALVNGPGARWFIHRSIHAELAKLDLHGDLQVEGRLLSGFTFRDGDFASTTTEASLHFDHLTIRYRFLELLDKKIRSIEGSEVRIVTVASGKKPDKEFTLPDFELIGSQLRNALALARPVYLQLDIIDVRLLRPDADPLDFHLDSLSHPAESNSFDFLGLTSNALGDQGLPSQDLRIIWTEDEFALNQLTLFSNLVLGSTRINYESGSPMELFGGLTANSSQLIVFADSTGTLELDLNNDTLDLAAAVARFAPDLKITGTIPQLHLKAQGLFGPPADWNIAAQLEGRDLQWQSGSLPSAKIDLTVDDRAQLTADLKDGLTIHLDLEKPSSSQQDKPDWWKGLAGELKLELASIHQSLHKIYPALGKELPDLTKIPDGKFTFHSQIITGGPHDLQVPKADWSLTTSTLGGSPLPDLKGTASLQDHSAGLTFDLAAPKDAETFGLEASYELDEESYTATLTAAFPDVAWMTPFINGDSPDWKPVEKLGLTWSGAGSIPNQTHKGTATITDLTLTSPGEPGTTSATLKANYDWPKSVHLPTLSLRNGDLLLDGSIEWTENTLRIPVLRLHDAKGQLASINGSLPLSPEDKELDAILARKGPIEIILRAEDLKLQRLASILPLNLPDGLTATVHSDLKLGGTFAKPTLAGTLRGTDIHLPSPESLPLLTAQLDLETREGSLHTVGTLTEPGGKVLSLTGSLPLATSTWIDEPAALQQLPLDLTAKIDQLALSRLQILAPALAKVEGSLQGEIHVSGSSDKPILSGTASASMKRFPLPDSPFRELRDTSLRLRLDGQRIVVEPSTTMIAGGRFTLTGDVDFAGEEPALDLHLGADHALLWRNDSFILRSNSSLDLKGPFSAARLSGSLELVESLFYKDIEIIPIGVPTSSAPKPKLPTIDKAKVASSLDLPAPFNAWTLDLSIKTRDPILIRGNLATGKITADVRIGGTLANPRPSGKLHIKDAEAALPFSRLTVKDGSIVLRPDAPLDPVLDIRGNSNINSRQISLYVYGPLSNPKYTLSSDQGLPENEILTLLATGTTAADLEDPEVAKSKAFQIFVDGLRRRANRPGGNKVFRRVLNELDEVDLKVGENDPFSGRKFNSATLQIEDRWYLSAAVDNAGNTRGLIIFSMRFR